MPKVEEILEERIKRLLKEKPELAEMNGIMIIDAKRFGKRESSLMCVSSKDKRKKQKPYKTIIEQYIFQLCKYHETGNSFLIKML